MPILVFLQAAAAVAAAAAVVGHRSRLWCCFLAAAPLRKICFVGFAVAAAAAAALCWNDEVAVVNAAADLSDGAKTELDALPMLRPFRDCYREILPQLPQQLRLLHSSNSRDFENVDAVVIHVGRNYCSHCCCCYPPPMDHHHHRSCSRRGNFDLANENFDDLPPPFPTLFVVVDGNGQPPRQPIAGTTVVDVPGLVVEGEHLRGRRQQRGYLRRLN